MREKTSGAAAQSDAIAGHNHNRSNSDSLLMVTASTDELQYGSVMAFDNYWDAEKMTDLHDLRGVDFLGRGHDETRQEEQHEPQHESQNINNEIIQQEVAKQQQDSILGILTPSTSSTPPRFETFATTDESLDFDAALKLCSDLDRSYRALRDGQTQTSTQEVEGIIRMVEYTCATARTATFSAAAEKASTALILAAIYKVFDVIETLVRQINDMCNSAQDALERLLRMKRMDIALLQAYMFLNQMGQTDAVKKISEIHTWMDSILQQQQYQMIW